MRGLRLVMKRTTGASKTRPQPYEALGSLIENWRQSAGIRSALALYKEEGSGFSFSYNTYAEFEKGARLPSIEQLLEIANRFSIDHIYASLVWCEAQMPENKLREFYKNQAQAHQNHSRSTEIKKTSAPQLDSLNLDSTWVFDRQDHDMLLSDQGRLLDLVDRLMRVFPRFVNWQELGFDDIESFEKLVRSRLNTWIEKGRIIHENHSLRLAKPHYHIPQDISWIYMRFENMKRVLESMQTHELNSLNTGPGHLSMDLSFFSLCNRHVDASSLKSVVHLLKTMRQEFLALPYYQSQSANTDDSNENEVMSLILAFGSRPLKPPRS